MGLDFDKLKIAKDYVKARTLSPAAALVWQAAILKYVEPKKVRKILDLGCGTGSFIPILQKIFPKAEIIGVDPAATMLAEAKKLYKKSGIKFLRGKAEKIPLPDASADLVLCSMMWHTLSSEKQAVKEIKRVLRPGGYLVIRQVTRENNNSLHLFKFFREAKKISYSLVLSRKKIIQQAKSGGLKFVAFKLIMHPYTPDFNSFYKKVSLRGISVIKMLPEKSFQLGLARLKKYCKTHGTKGPVLEPRDLFVFQKA